MGKCIYVGGDLKKIKEAYDLLVLGGYKAYDTTGVNFWANQKAKYLVIDFCKQYVDWKNSNEDDDDKEITLPQLRDLAVLRRNSIDDATHTDQDNWKWYIGADSYVWQAGNAQQLKQWDKSSLDHVDLKPIEKTMKEYIAQVNGVYRLIDNNEVVSGRIEVPEGSNYAYKATRGAVIFMKTRSEIGSVRDSEIVWQRTTEKEYLNKTTGEYRKTSGNVTGDNWVEIPDGAEIAFRNLYGDGIGFTTSDWMTEWSSMHNRKTKRLCPLNYEYKKNIIWQRHAQPLIDDEPKDNVNHPNHYASSSIECIDAMQAMLTPEQFIGYLRGNIFKYQWRYENKNGAEDLEKSQWYLNKLLSLY